MILVNSGAFLSISSWFCELTELIFVMIPYISSTGYPPKRKGLWVMCNSEYLNFRDVRVNLTCNSQTCLSLPNPDQHSHSRSSLFSELSWGLTSSILHRTRHDPYWDRHVIVWDRSVCFSYPFDPCLENAEP